MTATGLPSRHGFLLWGELKDSSESSKALGIEEHERVYVYVRARVFGLLTATIISPILPHFREGSGGSVHAVGNFLRGFDFTHHDRLSSHLLQMPYSRQAEKHHRDRGPARPQKQGAERVG